MKARRDGTEIKVWMLRSGLSMAEVARQIGVSKNLVSITINGSRNNRRVLRALLGHGCPADLLALPTDFFSNRAAYSFGDPCLKDRHRVEIGDGRITG